MKMSRAGYGALFLTFLALLGPSQAQPVASGLQKFNVVRNGDVIGSHVMAIQSDGDTVNVDIQTDITVKMLMISVYHFEHQGHEVWRGGQLQSLSSKTNDDGTRHALQVRGTPAGLEVAGDGKSWNGPAPAGAIPASLWNPALVTQSRLLNTLTGSPMDIRVAEGGDDSVPVGGMPRQAKHYILTGDLNREVWYDGNGELVHVRFLADDKSTIDYIRQ